MFVRSSKYRHIFGLPAKKDQCYEGIRVTKNAHDSNYCAVNPKFVAVVVESGGGSAFVALPIEKVGRVEVTVPKVYGHRGPVTDIRWNPFDDNIIASCSEDAHIKLWHIPDGGLAEDLTQSEADLSAHSKKVTSIEWHPTAVDILISAAMDHQVGRVEVTVPKVYGHRGPVTDIRWNPFDLLIIVWNTETACAVNVIAVHRDTIFSVSWNRDGSLFATTSKDRIIRVIDPRTGNVVCEGEGHQGNKTSKLVFLGDKSKVFTSGFSKNNERECAVWDVSGGSVKTLYKESIDASSGVLMPFYDPDTSVVYLAGKGDGNIRYFEVVDSPPYAHFLDQYQSNTPQRGLGMMPKRGVDVSRCEVIRFYKLHTLKDICEPIAMIVPRKAEAFQADIFPPTASIIPSLSAEEWLLGADRGPVLVSLKDGKINEKTIGSIMQKKQSSQRTQVKPIQKEETKKEEVHSIAASERQNGFQSDHKRTGENGRETSKCGQLVNGYSSVLNDEPSEEPTVTVKKRKQELEQEVLSPVSPTSKFNIPARSKTPSVGSGFSNQPAHLTQTSMTESSGISSTSTLNTSKPWQTSANCELDERLSSHSAENQSVSDYSGFNRNKQFGGETAAMDRHRQNNSEEKSVARDIKDSFEEEEDEDIETRGGRTVMIDCISMEAPDDVLIKPSVLRESMRRSRRQKSSETSSPSSDTLSGSNISGGVSFPADGPPSFKRGIYRTGSLREKGQRISGSSFTDLGGGLERYKTDLADGSMLKPREEDRTKNSSANEVPERLRYLFSVDLPKPSTPQVTGAVNNNNNNNSNKTGSMMTNGVSPTKHVGQENGGTVTSEDPLHRDYKELLAGYFRQQSEIKQLKEQIKIKDMNIRRLEDQLSSVGII